MRAVRKVCELAAVLNSITVAHCHQSVNFSNGHHILTTILDHRKELICHIERERERERERLSKVIMKYRPTGTRN